MSKKETRRRGRGVEGGGGGVLSLSIYPMILQFVVVSFWRTKL